MTSSTPSLPSSWYQDADTLIRQTVMENRWIPHRPHSKQAIYLALPVREALYGGAAGGGKSDALLMAALQYVDVPGYAALIVRRTYAMLAKPDSIMARAHEWLRGTTAHWDNETHTYTFPSGATVSFGHMQYESSIYDYQGAAYQFIGPDELTQFSKEQYLYLFSRLRRLEGSNIPIRMRPASNPGGEGHEWVYERFLVKGRAEGRVFVPANLADNPSLDRAEYEQSLAELDPLTRDQLLRGLWVVDPTTRSFKREWWRGRNRYDATDQGLVHRCVGRYQFWDTGFKDKQTSAFTALTELELLPDYRVILRRVQREKLIFPDLVPVIEREATRGNRDGKLRGVVIEDKASGTSAYQTLRQAGPEWLQGLLVPFEPRGGKPERGRQAAVWGKLGCIWHPQPGDAVPWLHDFEAELYAAPDAEFMDQHDSYVMGILYLEHLIAEGQRVREGQAVA